MSGSAPSGYKDGGEVRELLRAPPGSIARHDTNPAHNGRMESHQGDLRNITLARKHIIVGLLAAASRQTPVLNPSNGQPIFTTQHCLPDRYRCGCFELGKK